MISGDNKHILVKSRRAPLSKVVHDVHRREIGFLPDETALHVVAKEPTRSEVRVNALSVRARGGRRKAMVFMAALMRHGRFGDLLPLHISGRAIEAVELKFMRRQLRVALFLFSHSSHDKNFVLPDDRRARASPGKRLLPLHVPGLAPLERRMSVRGNTVSRRATPVRPVSGRRRIFGSQGTRRHEACHSAKRYQSMGFHDLLYHSLGSPEIAIRNSSLPVCEDLQ